MAPPPDDYGWAYVDAQRATASADGPSGSLQFRWGSEDLVPGQFSGSADLVFYPNSTAHSADGSPDSSTGDGDHQQQSHDMSGSSLYLYGNMYVSGAIMAETYAIRQVTATEIDVSGSTVFGDTSDDTHMRTGSLEVSNTAVFSANVQASEYIYHQGDLDTFIRFQADDIDIQAGGVDFIKITEDGSQDLVRINPANADIDFIVSTSQSSGSLKIDGATGDIHFGGDQMVFDHSAGELRIRPGTTDQGTIKLHSRDGTADDEAQLQFMRYTDGTFGLGDNLGIIQFNGSEDEDGTYYTAASIVGEVDEAAWADGSSNAGRLRFYTTADGDTGGTKRMEIGSDGTVEITGSLEVSANAIFSGEIHAANWIRHLGDGEDGHSDTYIYMTNDHMQFRTGSNNMISMTSYDGSGSQNQIRFNAGSNNPDTDMYMYSSDGTPAFFVRSLDPLISHPQVNSSMHISAALGPVTGSGEVHAARFVSNDIFTSGSVHIGGSDPLSEPDEKNDLVIGDHTGNRGMTIASTNTGVGTIRFAPYAAANNGEGWIDYSGNTNKMRFGTNGLNTRMTIGAAGNVGIGVGDPDTTLEVMSTTAQLKLSYDGSNYASIQANSAGTLILSPSSEYFIVNADTATYLRSDLIKLGRGGATDTTITFDGSTNDMSIVYDESAKTLAFDTSDLFIDAANARVGIGTATPDSTLEVMSTSTQLKLSYDGSNATTFDINSAGNLTVASPSAVALDGENLIWAKTDQLTVGRNDTGDTSLVFAGSTNSMAIAYDESLKKLAFNTDNLIVNGQGGGQVGIGVVDPDAQLEVMTTGSQMKLSYDASNYAGFDVFSGGDLKIQPSGGDLTLAADTQVTGSLEVSANAIVSGEIHVAERIRHLGDSDTYIRFADDQISFYPDHDALMLKSHTTYAGLTASFNGDSGPVVFTINADTENGTGGDLRFKGHDPLNGAAGSTLNYSGTLGPVSGSGEIHAAGFTGNNAYLSGTLHVGNGATGLSTIWVNNSGSTPAITITGGLTASHDVKVQNLYTNDLHISGTAYGITVDRANYASASNQATVRTYSPSGFDTSGYLYVSGSTILGSSASCDTQVTGTFEASGPANFTSTVTAESHLIVGGTLQLPDNTSGKILVADGTSFQEVAVGGDATISVSAGTAAITIAAAAVENGMVNENVIGSAGNLGATAAQADELLIYDADASLGGRLKAITISNLEDTVFGNISGDATVAAGGALTIAAGAVEGSMLNTDVISAQTNMTGDVADTDEIMISDAGTLKRIDFSVLRDAVFADISGGATVASGGSLSFSSVALSALDIDGGTDIGAALTGTDLIIVDDGASGTNRKAALSRIATYVRTDVSALGAAEGSKALVLDANAKLNSGLAYLRATELSASTAIVAGSLLASGSTVLGEHASDTHQVTGSFEVSGLAHFTTTVNAEAALNVNGLLSVTAQTAGTRTKLGMLSGDDHQVTGSMHMAHTLDVTGAVGVGGALTTYGDFRATDNTQIGASNSNTHQVSGTVHVSSTMDVSGAVGVMTDLRVWGHSTFGKAAGYDHQFTGSVYVSSKLNVTGTLAASGDITTNGNLDIQEGQLRMPDNTSAKILVADGTSYQEVAVSGDVAIASNGAVTIANDAVTNAMLADDAVDTAQIADAAITNALIDNATIRADKLDIANSTDIGAGLADGDMLVIADVGSSANRKTELSRLKTYTKTDISTAGTAEASKAVILDASKDIATLGGVMMTCLGVTGSISALGDMSGSGKVQIQGSASFGAPVDISGDLVFHAAATAGLIDIKVNDGNGADTAIQIGKNGKVTKIGDDTPSDGQYLSWDDTAGKVAWADGLTVWGMSGSDAHYSSTELRTSGDLSVSGSVTLGGISAGSPTSNLFLGLDGNNNIVKAEASVTYTSDGAEIAFGADSEVKLIHSPDDGLIIKRTATGDNSPTTLTLQTGETTLVATDTIGALQFQAPDETQGGDGALVVASIVATATDTFDATSNSTSLDFKTATDGAAVTHMRLLGSGKLQGYGNNATTWDVTADGTGSFQQLAIADKLVHSGDAGGEDTGIFFEDNSVKIHAQTNSQPQITVLSSEVVINESSNSLDFRVESNGEDKMFFVDGGANRIEIAGGYGSSGMKISTTGSMQTDGHIQADGGFFTAGDIEVAGDLTITGDLIASSATPEFATVTVASDIVHTGDANTKIAFDTDQMTLWAGGRNMLQFIEDDTQDTARFNTGNNDIDFIVSTSVSSGSFQIDGDTGDIHLGGSQVVYDHSDCAIRVYPNDTATQAKILLHSRDTTSADEAQLQFLRYTDGSLGAGDNLGIIQFKGAETVDGTYYTGASIFAEVDEAAWTDGSSTAGRLLFYTTPDGSTTGVEALRIDSDQKATFANDLTVNSPSTANIRCYSDSGESSLSLYGAGDAMSDGDNIGGVRFYGTEADGGGNNAQVGYMIVETAEASWAYNSSLATKMKFAVGLDASTTLEETLVLDGSNSDYARVGIGTSSPTYKLSVYTDDSATYIAQFRNASSTGYGIRIRNADDSSGRHVTFSNDAGTNGGHITMNGTTVTYGAFTGYHPAALPPADHDTGYEYGTIVKIASVDSTTYEKSVTYNVEKTTAAQDKAALGVWAGKMGECFNDDGSADRESGMHQIFSVGDGHILVCSEGGNIETGDFICSSNTDGHGMLQSDDLLHNYTVARASEPVDWSTEDSNTKLIACTYHAG